MSMKLFEMNIPKFPVLKYSEIRSKIEDAQNGDMDARDRLINCNLRLVFNTVKSFLNRGYESEDLFQVGTIGLIKAIDKFDLSFNVKFSTYAVPVIWGEISRFLREDNYIKISRSYKEISFKVYICREKLIRKLNREPKLEEIAKDLDLKTADIITALDAVRAPTSIYEVLYQDDKSSICLLDQLADEKTSGEQWFNQILINEILDMLPDKEKEILKLRYIYDKTQSEISKIIGISQVQVSRIENKILNSLRRRLGTED